MAHKSSIQKFIFISLLALAFSGCYRPPYNNFRSYNRIYVPSGEAAVAGSIAVAAATGPVGLGTATGAAIGALIGINKDSKRSILTALKKFDVQVVEYGNTITMIVPTDRYFIFNRARFNELCYPGLYNIIKFIKMYPSCCPIYVAGFSDNVGSRKYKTRMSQARAETMLTFLWANGIPSPRLAAEGYGDKNTVADNKLIHGSAQNRRLEIQLITACSNNNSSVPFLGMTK